MAIGCYYFEYGNTTECTLLNDSEDSTSMRRGEDMARRCYPKTCFHNAPDAMLLVPARRKLCADLRQTKTPSSCEEIQHDQQNRKENGVVREFLRVLGMVFFRREFYVRSPLAIFCADKLIDAVVV